MKAQLMEQMGLSLSPGEVVVKCIKTHWSDFLLVTSSPRGICIFRAYFSSLTKATKIEDIGWRRLPGICFLTRNIQPVVQLLKYIEEGRAKKRPVVGDYRVLGRFVFERPDERVEFKRRCIEGGVRYSRNGKTYVYLTECKFVESVGMFLATGRRVSWSTSAAYAQDIINALEGYEHDTENKSIEVLYEQER